MGTAPRPPTKLVLSTRSCRTNNTWRSATSNALYALGETRFGSSCRSGSIRTTCLNASTALRIESRAPYVKPSARGRTSCSRSEEHTSELQSPYDLVCRLLLEKKKEKQKTS